MTEDMIASEAVENEMQAEKIERWRLMIYELLSPAQQQGIGVNSDAERAEWGSNIIQALNHVGVGVFDELEPASQIRVFRQVCGRVRVGEWLRVPVQLGSSLFRV